MTKLKDVDPNSKTGRRVIGDLRKKLGTDDRNDIISFGKKYGILKDIPVKPAFKKDGGLAEAIDKVKAKEMKFGGEASKGKTVPPKFKGFSMLPESVQKNMDADLAEKFGMGGDVKGKKGKNICRGRGIARKGTGFTLR